MTPGERARGQFEHSTLPLYARKQLYNHTLDPELMPLEKFFDDHGGEALGPVIKSVIERSTPIERRLSDQLYKDGFLRGDERMLEIGCGPGDFLDMLRLAHDHEGEIIGVDLLPQIMDFNHLKVLEYNNKPSIDTGIDLVVGNGEELELPDDSFDATFISNMLYHANHPEKVLDEAMRVTTPGGLIVIQSRGRNNLREIWDTSQIFARLISEKLGWPPDALRAGNAFYNDFGINKVRLGARRRFSVVEDFEESIQNEYRLKVAPDKWEWLRDALIHTNENNFYFTNPYTGKEELLPVNPEDLRKLTESFVRERFNYDVRINGYSEIHVEEMYLIARNDKKAQ